MSALSLPMTARQKTALRTAVAFFGTWLLLALAIADFPPPPGFLALILLACALLVYLRVPAYLRWRAEGAQGRVLRVARDGFLAGGVIALLSLLSPGEPGIQPGLSDRLIGISVLIGLGVVNALAAFAFGLWLCQRTLGMPRIHRYATPPRPPKHQPRRH
jgi:hypothetical protein